MQFTDKNPRNFKDEKQMVEISFTLYRLFADCLFLNFKHPIFY